MLAGIVPEATGVSVRRHSIFRRRLASFGPPLRLGAPTNWDTRRPRYDENGASANYAHKYPPYADLVPNSPARHH